MKTKFIYISIILIILFGGWWYFSKTPSTTNSSTINKLDSLKNTQEHIRDSINIINDTIVDKIKQIHTTYEKNVEHIIIQSHDNDWRFLKEYLSGYSLDSTGLKKIRPNTSSTQ